METTAVHGRVEAPQTQSHTSNAAKAVERVERRRDRHEEEVRVTISEEARARREARDREPVAPPTDAPSRSANSGPAPILAVRVGLPEVPQVPDSEELLRQKLAERSGIQSVRLGGLVTTPQEQERAASRAETRRGTEEARIELPGAQAARPQLPGAPEPVRLPVFETARSKPDAPAPQPPVHKVRDPEADQAAREARQREIMERADRRPDLDTAIAAGAHGTITRGEEDAQPRRTDSTREADLQDEAARKRAVQAALTQAAVVEAESTGELVTRFAERAFEQDLGRPERVREHLGNRSASPAKLND